jgi:GH43 family beta-xylosidase
MSVVSFTSGCENDNYPEVKLQEPPVSTAFTNPVQNGADPWMLKANGTYYYQQTMGDRVRLWQTDDPTQLESAISRDIFIPQDGAPNSKNVWAPEIYNLDGKWYVYYTAGDGQDVNQRTWVLENTSNDPMTGEWVDKGKIYNENADFWAIDGTVMEYNNNRYFVWCGRPDATNVDLTQKIYISKMKNPWTLEGDVTLLSEPEYDWERVGFGVNEAPEVLEGPNGYFLTYSASYCGTDDYALGMLTLKPGGDPMVVTDWEKSATPVFSKKPENNAYGPGHNGFFKSPDGSENWIIYHANLNSGEGCSTQRNVRMQPFVFGDSGQPQFGEPVSTDEELEKPAGDL